MRVEGIGYKEEITEIRGQIQVTNEARHKMMKELQDMTEKRDELQSMYDTALKRCERQDAQIQRLNDHVKTLQQELQDAENQILKDKAVSERVIDSL